MAEARSDSFFDRVGEFYTLSAAKAAQAKLGEPARKAMDRALSIGRQRADAAESLWSNGHTAEALQLAVRALDDTLEAAPPYVRALGLALAPATAPKAPEKPAEKAAEKPAEKVAEKPAEKAEAKAEPKEEADEASEKSKGEDEAKDDAAKDEAKDEAPKDEAKDEAAKDEAPEDAPAKTEKADDEPAAPALEEEWAAALRARGAAQQVEKVRTARAAVGRTALPLLDADVSAAHADLFQQVLDARHVVDRAMGSVALAPRDLGWTRFSRIATTTVVALVAVVGLYLGLRTPEGVFADASDVWAQAPQFAAENAIDGNDDTYWLLPDGATGWVEARISPAVDISHVRLLNTHNPPHNDRATRDYAVEVYSGGELAQTIEGSFEFSTHPEFVTHDVTVSHVDRIRFVVRGHHHVGAGLAELQWE